MSDEKGTNAESDTEHKKAMEVTGAMNLLDLGDHRGQLVSDDGLGDQRLAEDLRKRECPSFSQCSKGQGR